MSDQEDFTMRTITRKSPPFEVTRTRTSNGFASITIKVDGSREISLDNREAEGPGSYGQRYEQVAITLARLIEEVAGEPCTLPEIKS